MSIQPPDPRAIIAAMSPQRANAPLTARDAAVLHSPETMRVAYGMDADVYDAAAAIMHPPGTPVAAHSQSPFSAVPVASSYGEYYETIAIFAHESDVFMHPDDAWLYPAAGPSAGYHYQNNAEVPMPWVGPNNSSGAPAPITEVPTSSKFPERPRTVAAGYDGKRKCLTVVFRDGTYYNYYDVTALQWRNFKSARSKGQYIYTHLDSHPRGVADVSALNTEAREALYRVSRTGQKQRKGLTAGHKADSPRGNKANTYRKGNLGGTGRKRINKAKGN